ncbi:hypothetical protein P8625_12820 [Tenacibaculum tangerinum]|uniref:Uncharacterized protein n=1 Tax=Tenacibaculum tangerinum TaxID=3038772 RepID=A0ABY8L0S1_9FLAO|nr:hypothetical protein [Tenacibaculum tangerinum]WGH74950.1 hypothetical protein P8625_12820 [Tenacibaculum tangerinum]
MDAKKDIGILLKDKLRELKDSPDEIVWVHIEKELVKEKRKKGRKELLVF